MGKKTKKDDNDLYQIEQVNKKHRGKSDKIAKKVIIKISIIECIV